MGQRVGGKGEPPIRTSETHPITLSCVLGKLGEVEGRVGMCYCPGKEVVRQGIQWVRDLATDLARLRDHFKVTVVVCLLNDYELRTYKIQRYGDAVRGAGLSYVQFPIVEMAAPESMDETMTLIQELQRLVRGGESLAIHCRGGVGRAGTIVACLYLYLGICTGKKAAADAIALVRKRRCPQAVESRRQEEFIAKFASICVAPKVT